MLELVGWTPDLWFLTESICWWKTMSLLYVMIRIRILLNHSLVSILKDKLFIDCVFCLFIYKSNLFLLFYLLKNKDEGHSYGDIPFKGKALFDKNKSTIFWVRLVQRTFLNLPFWFCFVDYHFLRCILQLIKGWKLQKIGTLKKILY
jgi:hypothetical protein